MPSFMVTTEKVITMLTTKIDAYDDDDKICIIDRLTQTMWPGDDDADENVD